MEIKRENPASRQTRIAAFVRKNTVLLIALALAVLSIALVPPDEAYAGYYDLKTLCCLFGTLAVVCALKNIHFFSILAQRIIVSRETIHSFLDAMPKNDENLVVFDVNLRQGFYSKEILCASMRRCNILKINDEELVAVSRMFGYPGIDLQDKCWILLGKYNLKMLILTCGINGSYVFTPGHVSYQPTPKVEVADTVGAGDSFTAAFIASILKGKSVAEAHTLAVQTSAFVCTKNGAMPILPAELTE